MVHTEVYEKYKKMFPELAIHVEDWFPNGKDSIRVRVKSGSDFIFTYHNWNDWRYETVDSFIRELKGGRKMNVGLHENSHENE